MRLSDTRGELDGLRVLVTRPADQAVSIRRLLESQGAHVLCLPMQVIEPVRHAAHAAQQLQTQRHAAYWIFTSANAVRHAHRLDAGVWPACIAIGSATAKALSELGIASMLPTSNQDSEGLLELPALQDPAQHRYALITGEGGRELIEQTLSTRGAPIERIEVYRRVSLPHAPATISAALAEVDVVMVTNGESLARLHELTPDTDRPRLLSRLLVAPSRRVVDLALRLGFVQTPLQVERVSDAEYLRCLRHWRQSTRPRPQP
jgi:uroporphyrinogen-III synthase